MLLDRQNDVFGGFCNGLPQGICHGLLHNEISREDDGSLDTTIPHNGQGHTMSGGARKAGKEELKAAAQFLQARVMLSDEVGIEDHQKVENQDSLVLEASGKE